MIKLVRKADLPFLADWVTITLRWVSIVIIFAVQAWYGPASLPLTAVAGGLAVWNLVLSFLALNNRRLVGHRWLNVLVDSAAALVFFILSGGLQGPLAGAGVLALFSAAMYYEWRGALLTAVLITGAQAGWLAWQGLLSADNWIIPLLILVAINGLLGVVLGLLGLRAMRGLRQRYFAQINARQEDEQKVRLSERNRLQTFYAMIETLSATIDYRLVLESTLDLSLNALGSSAETQGLISAVLLFGEQNLEVAMARGFSATDMRQSFPGDGGLLGEALKSGGPCTITQPGSDVELQPVFAFQPCQVALALPLLRGLNAYGVIVFAHPQADFFTSERVEVLEMISHQAVIAIQNARLFQDVQQEKDRIIASQEETRKKLARDLHDGPTQSVTAIAMRINIARRLVELRPQDVPAELERIEDLARHTTEEIRHMLFTLRPLALESEGIVAALQQMSDKMKETFQQNVTLDIDPATTAKLDLNKQTMVFYLVEEAVNNARKHAAAQEIHVSLKFINAEGSLALLEIADNGKGFDVSEVTAAYDRRGSLGLVNLQERTALVNGILHLDSAPGKGTRVQIVIPLTPAAVDRLQRGVTNLS